MTIFTDGKGEITFQANDLDDAIELFNVTTFPNARQAGVRIETARSGYFRLIVPIRDWPCHSHPEGKKKWCDHEGGGGFMGHTCVKSK